MVGYGRRVRALSLPAVASIHPKMREAREQPFGVIQKRLDPLVVHHLRAVDLGFEHEAFRVH